MLGTRDNLDELGARPMKIRHKDAAADGPTTNVSEAAFAAVWKAKGWEEVPDEQPAATPDEQSAAEAPDEQPAATAPSKSKKGS